VIFQDFETARISDIVLDHYRAQYEESLRATEELCSRAIAADVFCREYIGKRFSILERMDGRGPKQVLVLRLPLRERLRLAWLLVRAGGGKA
jgi:hypothetical protein